VLTADCNPVDRGKKQEARALELALGSRAAQVQTRDRRLHHEDMRKLPTGTVTLLFTDIEGSTRLLQEFGDVYREARAEHRRVLRAAFVNHGGVEVDTQGDSFFVDTRTA
jgi:class 3 adenylate cyclase